jgi:hypothetical protein
LGTDNFFNRETFGAAYDEYELSYCSAFWDTKHVTHGFTH